jgi:hypothetical protein
MASATEAKPAHSSTGKNSSRQPPAHTVWLKYQPNAEGILSWHASAALHALIFGGILLWSLYLAAFFFGKPNRSLPMEAVTFQDAGGGGTKDGTGDGPGGPHAPLSEGAQEGDKPTSGDTKPSDADRPHLPDDLVKKVEQEFAAPDARFVKELPPGAMEKLLGLENDAMKKMQDGINPSKGQGGPGKDGGVGPGTGPGQGTGTKEGTGKMLNEREKRMLRWSMKFNTRDGGDYLRQLEGLGSLLAIPVGPNDYKIVDLTKRPLHMEDRDLSTIQRIWWIDDNPSSVMSLMRAMGIPGQPSRVVAFIPPELEEEIAKKELAFHGLKEEQIYETKFEVRQVGGKYEVHVTGQTAK